MLVLGSVHPLNSGTGNKYQYKKRLDIKKKMFILYTIADLEQAVTNGYLVNG